MEENALFRGPSVTLRPFEPDDVAGLRGYLNDPELCGRRYIPWGFPEIAPLSQRQIEAVYEKWAGEEKGLPLAIVRNDSGELTGHAECDWGWDPHSPSVSVVVAPPHQHQGNGGEALDLLLRYLFDYTPAHSVGCWIADWNEPALRFAARHSFRQGGRVRRIGLRQGAEYDMIVADILRPEWQQKGGTGHGA
jgi:RimJ/RimL family protein N-acetyltransferase